MRSTRRGSLRSTGSSPSASSVAASRSDAGPSTSPSQEAAIVWVSSMIWKPGASRARVPSRVIMARNTAAMTGGNTSPKSASSRNKVVNMAASGTMPGPRCCARNWASAGSSRLLPGGCGPRGVGEVEQRVVQLGRIAPGHREQQAAQGGLLQRVQPARPSRSRSAL